MGTLLDSHTLTVTEAEQHMDILLSLGMHIERELKGSLFSGLRARLLEQVDDNLDELASFVKGLRDMPSSVEEKT